MKGEKAVRVVLDALMTAMIVFEMLIQFTGEFLHEVVGFAFFATVLAHVLLSMKWVKSTARAANTGKLNARRAALAVVGILLAVTTAVLGISSIAISGILASAGFTWTLGSYAMWAYIHMISSYVLCGLVVVHLAMHWVFLASVLKVPYDPSRRRAISTGVNAVAALGVVALGVTVSGKALAQSGTGAVEQGSATGADAATAALDATDAPATQSSSSSASSSSSGSSGKESRKKDDSASTVGGSSGSAGTSGGSSAPGSSGSGSTSGSSTSESGICTLCRKRCSLSAPKCDKPYAAGLL